MKAGGAPGEVWPLGAVVGGSQPDAYRQGWGALGLGAGLSKSIVFWSGLDNLQRKATAAQS